MSASFEAIGIVARDLSASLAFYRLLGLEFPEGAESAPHVEATLPGGIRFMIDTVETIHSFDPEWQPASGGPQVAIAFRCDSPSDVDETFRELVEGGATPHKEPWDAFWGQRYAQVRDPDGNAVDLFAAL